MPRFALRRSLRLLVACFALPMKLAGQATVRDSVALHAAVTQFLQAFENLEWDRFAATFSDDVTVFFPLPEPPQRFVGRAAVEGQFRKVFAGIRASASGGPPYQHLPPVDLRIQMLGEGFGLVSFELRNAERVGRRTFVWRRAGGQWRIIHLHASSVPTPTGTPPGA